MLRLILIILIGIFIILFILEHSKLTGKILCTPQFSKEELEIIKSHGGKEFSFDGQNTPYRYSFISLFGNSIDNRDKAYNEINWRGRDCYSFWSKEGIFLEAALADMKTAIVKTVLLGFLFDYKCKYCLLLCPANSIGFIV